MKCLIVLTFVSAALAPLGQAQAQTDAQAYPSCDIPAQRALAGALGGALTDPRQAHISVRANILQADIGSAHKARLLSQGKADRLWKRADTARQGADHYTLEQGFLSAGEVASYDRELDAVAAQLCRRVKSR